VLDVHEEAHVLRIEVDCSDWRERVFRVEREDMGFTLITWFDRSANEARLRLSEASADLLAQSLLGFMRDDDLYQDIMAALATLAHQQKEWAILERGLDAQDEPDARVAATMALMERLRAAMIVRDATQNVPV
jgi:hypothetical protein